LKNVNEGEIIQINKVEVKDGYKGQEIHLQPRSTIDILDASDYTNFPEYKEPITKIEDIIPDTKVNIIARIIRIPKVRKFEKNGKEGEVTSLELQDDSGKISYTLWNKDVKLIDSLELNEGSSVKILSAQARERNGEISLSHWDGRIVKGDFEVPEFEENIIKIGEASEQKDVVVIGIITKIQDPITFERSDGSEGLVKSIEILDDTGSIRITLWGDDTLLEINKGDIFKVIGGNIEFDEYASSGYRVNTNWNTRFIINPKDDPIVDVLKEYQTQLGPIRIEEVQEIEDDGEEVDIIGRIISINETREFLRDDGTTGIVRSLNLADESGLIRLSFWDDKAKENFQIGDAYQIENARTKMGMYSVDLNIGKTSRVIKLNDEEASFLPSFETLEEMIYTSKKIMDLDEDDMHIRVVGRIIELFEVREFPRDDGTKGLVRNIEFADDTGSIRITLWGEDANTQFELGSGIKLVDPRVNFNNEHLELNVSGNTSILTPTDKELESLPSYEELQDIIYQAKTIESLEDNDSNVRITGVFTTKSEGNILINKCPNCNNTVEQTDDEFVCDFCGEEIEKPKHLLMIPGTFKDDTGEISITFFNNLAEELLGIKLEDIVAIIEDSSDYGALEGKIEDLNGLNMEIIANVSFNDYDEEIRLNPKKILSKNY
ncbi:MAG: replication protein A, partial [Methanobrevibacter sp.]|nr:replication protein A [Methanobrevibacter sp.]